VQFSRGIRRHQGDSVRAFCKRDIFLYSAYFVLSFTHHCAIIRLHHQLRVCFLCSVASFSTSSDYQSPKTKQIRREIFAGEVSDDNIGGFFSWRFSAASSDAEVHFPLYLTIKLNPKTATVRQQNGPERTKLLKFVTLRRLFLEDLENSCCILLNSLHLVFSSCLFRSCATVTRAIVRHC
jgi:hypothetical protein